MQFISDLVSFFVLLHPVYHGISHLKRALISGMNFVVLTNVALNLNRFSQVADL
jgi:hypothetical protein